MCHMHLQTKHMFRLQSGKLWLGLYFLQPPRYSQNSRTRPTAMNSCVLPRNATFDYIYPIMSE